MRAFPWFLGTLLLASVALADEPPSLDRAIAQAVAHSPEVATATTNVSFAETTLRSARWGFFHPELRVFAGDNAITGTTRAGIQISQDLMRLLTLNGEEVRHAEHELAVARQTLAIIRRRVIRQVTEAWGHLRLTEDSVDVNAEAVAEQTTLLALAQAQFDTGAGPLEHVLSARQALARAQHALRQAEDERWQARVVLSQLLDDPLPGLAMSS